MRVEKRKRGIFRDRITFVADSDEYAVFVMTPKDPSFSSITREYFVKKNERISIKIPSRWKLRSGSVVKLKDLVEYNRKLFSYKWL